MTRAQSSVLTELLMASAALVVGLAVLSYFTSFSSSYSQQVELANTLNYEAANQVVRFITYDNVSKAAWLLLRRLDSVGRNFVLILRSDSTFLTCERVFVYNGTRDTDGIVCNQANVDCVAACQYGPRQEQARNVYISLKDGVMPLSEYLKVQPTSTVQLVRIPYARAAADRRMSNLIVRVDLSNVPRDRLTVYLCVDYGSRFYVVRVYEVSLR